MLTSTEHAAEALESLSAIFHEVIITLGRPWRLGVVGCEALLGARTRRRGGGYDRRGGCRHRRLPRRSPVRRVAAIAALQLAMEPPRPYGRQTRSSRTKSPHVGPAVGGRQAHPADQSGHDGDGDQVREHLQEVDRDRHLIGHELIGEIDRQSEDDRGDDRARRPPAAEDEGGQRDVAIVPRCSRPGTGPGPP